MRLFIALDLPDAVRETLATWRAEVPGVRWTPPERMHLTLRFLGETSADAMLAITGQIAMVQSPPVPIHTADLIRLPSARRPRVLAVRVAETPELADLHARLEAALAEVGVPPEDRPLLPHVTLVRFRHPDAATLRRVLRSAEPPRAEGVADSFSLVRSQQGDGGPTYTTRLRVPLR